jgi:prevent-host-death family protein
MHMVDIHVAKRHLSRLIEEAAGGKAFIITKAGKPMVKVVPVEINRMEQRRVGFLLVSSTFPMISTEWADRHRNRFRP